MQEKPPAMTASTHSTPTSAIRLDNVVKHYGTGEHAVRAVDGVSFTLPPGVIAAIVGPSGSGKSTLLNLLGALDRPDTGEVWIGEQALSTLTEPDLVRLRRDHIGFVFQQFNLVPNLSAEENVTLPMEFAGLDKHARRKRARELLDAVGMAHRLGHRPAKLSGGEQQRVAIARALANDPDLILADEPTGNLDARTGADVIALLERLAADQHKTLLVITHDETLAATAHPVWHMHDGRLLDAPAVDEAIPSTQRR